MRRVIGLIALLLLVVVGVGIVLTQSNDEPTATSTGSTDDSIAVTSSLADDESTTSISTTDGTLAPTSTPPTTTAPSSSVGATTDSTTADGTVPEAVFAVTEIQFGEGGFVAIRNVGIVAGNLGGYALCNRPQYFQIPAIELEPLDIVWIAVGDGTALSAGAGGVAEIVPMNGALGTLDAGDGELGLYRSSAFDNPDAMITYVEWGAPGHGRSATAIEAGLWREGAFIEIPIDAFGIQSIAPPDRPAQSPDEWIAGVGG